MILEVNSYIFYINKTAEIVCIIPECETINLLLLFFDTKGSHQWHNFGCKLDKMDGKYVCYVYNLVRMFCYGKPWFVLHLI